MLRAVANQAPGFKYAGEFTYANLLTNLTTPEREVNKHGKAKQVQA